MTKPLIIIVGPTAIGKSALAVELALELQGEIISGDSIQIYKKLNIGSAKPSKEEQKGIPHHLIDLLDPTEYFTVAGFQQMTVDLIASIQEKNKVPIIVGGTGLYIRSILDGFSFPEKGTEHIKHKWLEYAKIRGNASLHRQLKNIDLISAEKLHPNDTARIIRALEVYEITGQPLSSQRDYQDREYCPLGASTIYIGLRAPREQVYERINQRCQNMLEDGLIVEIQELLREGYSPKLKSMQSIGYRHVIYYLKGLATFEEMLRLFQRDTRRFAKRQMTWFNRDPRIHWYDTTDRALDQLVIDIASTCRLNQTRVK